LIASAVIGRDRDWQEAQKSSPRDFTRVRSIAVAVSEATSEGPVDSQQRAASGRTIYDTGKFLHTSCGEDRSSHGPEEVRNSRSRSGSRARAQGLAKRRRRSRSGSRCRYLEHAASRYDSRERYGSRKRSGSRERYGNREHYSRRERSGSRERFRASHSYGGGVALRDTACSGSDPRSRSRSRSHGPHAGYGRRQDPRDTRQRNDGREQREAAPLSKSRNVDQAASKPEVASSRGAPVQSAWAGSAAVRRIPLPFAEYGHLYAFDPFTGVLFEASRQFYYDAGAQLYLDARTSTYLRLVGAAAAGAGRLEEPVFEPYQPPLPAGAPPPRAGLPVQVAMTVAAAALPATAASSIGAIRLAAPSTGTHYAATVADVVDAQTLVLTDSREAPDPQAAPAAASGAPAAAAAPRQAAIHSVCELCQRGFPSHEALRRHEDKSQLHATNLTARIASATTR
jgi:hypothetical protein